VPNDRPAVTDIRAAVDAWVAALSLERIAPGAFRAAAPPGGRRRTFGGMTMGQALVAAAHAVATELQAPSSVHCEFVRPGDPQVPIEFGATVTSTGRRFSTCTVVARQSRRVLFTLLARFHGHDAGLEFQAATPAKAPPPEALPDFPTHLAPHAAKVPDWSAGDSPIDVRMIDEGLRSGYRSWIRIGDGSTGARPPAGDIDRSLLGACGLLYAGDMTLIGTAPTPFGRAWSDDGVAIASLDHAMWLHRPFDIDGWLLYDQRVLSVAGSRALALGELYTSDGVLVATVMQHGLVELGRRS
jgi:acyl-CoA thioesterase-2